MFSPGKSRLVQSYVAHGGTKLAIIHATRPLQPTERTAFLAALGAVFHGRHDVGDGECGARASRSAGGALASRLAETTA